MKKSILISAAIVSLAMLASCQKEQFTENAAPATGVTEFFATIEQTTKTAIDADGKVSWKVGDEITVTDAASNTAVYVAGSDGASTTFTLKTGEIAVGDGPYSATYGDIDNQIYDAAGANCPLTAPETGTPTFSFSSPYAVVKITAKSEGGEVIDSVGVSYGGNDYTLDCGDGVTLTSDGNDFYVAVEPATDAALSVTFHTAGKTATKERKTAVSLAAKDLLPVTFTFVASDWKSPEADLPDGALKGVFTVSAGPDGIAGTDDDVKVHFSRGNLRYVLATQKWEFFEHQYDVCNTGTYEGHHSDTISLFTWGYGEWSTVPDTKGCLDNVSDGHNFPYANDWGSQVNGGNVWRTPSKDEWEFLLNTEGTSGRSDANRFARAMVNGVKGLLIFPDDYDLPSGYSASEGGIGMSKVNKKNNAGVDDAPFPSSDIPSEKWAEMESSGVVFLPAAGERYGSGIGTHNDYEFYWSSTAIKTDDAYSILFAEKGIGRGHEMINSYGISVRLVTNVSATPTPTPADGTRGTLNGHEYVVVAGVKWATQNLAITDSGNKKWKGANTGDNPEVKVPGTDDDVIVGDYFQWAAHENYALPVNNFDNGETDKGLLIYTSFTNTHCVDGGNEDKFEFKSPETDKTYRFNTAPSPYYSDETAAYISPYYATGYTHYNEVGTSSELKKDDDVANIILRRHPLTPLTSYKFVHTHSFAYVRFFTPILPVNVFNHHSGINILRNRHFFDRFRKISLYLQKLII